MAKKNKILKHARGHARKKKKGPGKQASPRQAQILQQALACHRSGRLPQAEALYRKILSEQPDHPEALHLLGMLAHQSGRSAIAVELINKALRANPDYFDAHFNLGNVHMAQEMMETAAASFRRAVALKPGHAGAHYNLGNALKAVGRLEEALASYTRAIDLQPDFTEGYINQGNIFKDLGRQEEAIASYRQALSLNPDYAAAVHNNLGIALKEMGRLEEAVASYRQAISLQPDYVNAHYNLGNALKEQGKMGEALASFQRALELKPDYVGAFSGMASIVKYQGIDDDIHRMHELLTTQGVIAVADRIDLGFTLGKVYEDIGEYAKSFPLILEANRQKRATYQYSLQNEHDFFDRIKKTFSEEFLAARLDQGNRDRTPIFIVGMPRSGTTLVEQILASHPRVFGAGELPVLHSLIQTLCRKLTTARFPECIPQLDASAFEQMGLKYVQAVRRYSDEAAFITDKMPKNFLRLGLIKIILPNARVIHCARNPMDNCYSIFKQHFQEDHPYAYDMAELGRYYTLYRDLMAHWQQVLPGFIYTLEYEKMVADQRRQTRQLLDFCGLDWDDACMSFHRAERTVTTASFAQVRQPIYSDSVELWKRYEEQLEPLREALSG